MKKIKLYRVTKNKKSQLILTTSKNRAVELSDFFKKMGKSEVEIIDRDPTISQIGDLDFVEINGLDNVLIDSSLYEESEIELI